MTISDDYNVSGFFYTEQGYNFRSHVNIRRKHTGLAKGLHALKKVFASEQPDLMVVMMNPGSATPMTGGDDGNLEVPIKADGTQRQIMKVMASADFDYARILNLSDLRDANSPDFLAALKPLDLAGIHHSIFGPGRQQDFDRLYDQTIPVVLAWGADDRLKPLARLALSRIHNAVKAGQRKPGNDWVFYHARQRGKPPQHWVNEIVAQLR